MAGPLSFLSGPSISHFLSPVPGRIPWSGEGGTTGGSLAHFLGMLPPKVRFPCPLAFPSSFRAPTTGSFSFWATGAQSATCPCVCKEQQRCLPTCSTRIELSGPLSLVPASASRFRRVTIVVVVVDSDSLRFFFIFFFFSGCSPRARVDFSLVFFLSTIVGFFPFFSPFCVLGFRRAVTEVSASSDLLSGCSVWVRDF